MMAQICGCSWRIRSAIHPFELIQALAVASEQDAVDDASGPIRSQGAGQHDADIFVRIDTQGGLVADVLKEAFQQLVNHVRRDVLQFGHGGADLLYFLGGHVGQHLGGAILAYRQQE